MVYCFLFFFFSSRRRHTRCGRDWSSDVCSSDLLSASEPDGSEWMPSCLVAAWWQPGGDGKAGAQPARRPVPPAAGSCGESSRRVRGPIPPKRRRSVDVQEEGDLHPARLGRAAATSLLLDLTFRGCLDQHARGL